MTERDLLLVEREKIHGSFDENARVWQALCHLAKNTTFTGDRQRLAIEMIFLKIARLLQNPDVKEHWDDVAGYAKLGSEGANK